MKNSNNFTKGETIAKTVTDLLFNLCFWWVLLVSLVDHYLTIKLQETILTAEKNPLGIILIEADNGSVALFMTLKMAFLWVIYFFLLNIYKVKKIYALVPLAALSIVQLILVFYFFEVPKFTGTP
jgi:hypothetical protein